MLHRTSWLLGLFLAALPLVVIAGCGPSSGEDGSSGSRPSRPDHADGPGGKSAHNESGPSPLPSGSTEPKLFDWPEPALGLVLTGQRMGYLEPCGCTEGQSGGISRQGDLIGQLNDRGWNLAGLELGGTVRRSRRQSQIKFETLLEAMKGMHYAAVGLGPAELRLGPDFLLAKHQPESGAAFLAANVVFYDSPDLGTPLAWKSIEVGGRTVAVTAVLGRSLQETVFPKDAQTAVTLTDPAEALSQVLEEMKQKDPDLRVLLSFAKRDESRALAERFADFDLVVSAGGPENPLGRPRRSGGTMLVEVGHKGRYVGIVGYYPDNADNPLRYELIELKADRFAHDAEMTGHMRYYHERLREEALAAEEPPIPHPSGSVYVGAEKCGECHTTAYEIWKNTPHAEAFESLKHSRPGEPDYNFTREFDPECLACHVTGWNPQEALRYESGFINPELARSPEEKARSELLKGQQCESCHGPGSRHVELVNEGKERAARELVRVTIKQARDKLCIRCHDIDNSPHFDFGEYWPQVEHYGLD